MKIKSYKELVQWEATWRQNHPHERYGQAFCNEFDIQCEDLFYTEDGYEARCIIEELICEQVGAENFWS